MNANELKRLKEVEELAKGLEPTEEQLRTWLTNLGEYSVHFLQNIEKVKGYNSNFDPIERINTSTIQEEPAALADVLADYHETAATIGLNPASGRHLGYIPGGGIITGAIGDYIAALTNLYAGVYFASPGAVRIEHTMIEWLVQVFKMPKSTTGTLTSGGSLANLIALVCARDARNVRSKDFEKLVIYTSSQTHHCVDKAIRIAGLADAQQRQIPLDDNYRMFPKAFREIIEQDKQAGLIPFLLVASAGTTDTGAVDPLVDLSTLCKANNIWFHIDAAYGGFFQLTHSAKQTLTGIELADSLVVDPHKGLFLPYGIGAVLVKDGKQLHESNRYQANYMQDAETARSEWSPAELSPELTRHFRGLRMWLSLRVLGLAPFRAALEQKLLLAQYAYDHLREMEGIETGPPPQLSVVLFRYKADSDDADALNRANVKSIQQEGEVFISSTTIDGIVWLRFAILAFRTDLKVIDNALEVVKSRLD